MKRAPATKTIEEQLDCVELPEGWVARRVEEVFRSYGGGTPNKGTATYWGGGIPWLSSGDIKTDRIQSASESITRAGLAGSSAHLCRAGSVVVVVRSGILKHTLPVAVLERNAAINQDIKCFDSGDDMLNAWLALALRSSTKAILRLNREGTTVQSVKYETLRAFDVPIPPLAEQDRIITLANHLRTRVGVTLTRLAKIPTLIKAFRQSVLAAACSGRLTEDWRSCQPQTESAEGLLDRIHDDRRNAHTKERCRDSTTSKTNYLEPQALDAEHLPAIPLTWAWATLDQIGQENRPIVYGIIKPGPHVPNGVPYVRVTEMKDGEVVDLSQLRRASPERAAKFERSTLAPGDLLISKDGTVGRVAIVPPELARGNVTQHVMRVAVHGFLNRYYIAMAVRAPHAQSWLVGELKGVALQGVNVEDFRRLPIPIPPVLEQLEIVRRVGALFKLAEKIEERVAVATKSAGKLTQAILAKAFRGELVPTEAELARSEGRGYEPASTLLERIKSECEKIAAAPKGNRHRPIRRNK